MKMPLLRGRWSDLAAIALVAGGVVVLGVTFWPRDGADAAGAPPLPVWREDDRPLDLVALAASPGLVWPPEVPLAGDGGPSHLALFVLAGRACSAVAGEVADYAAELAALDGGQGRIAPLALVLDSSPENARRFAAAAALPVPTAHGWDERAAEELGRFDDERRLLQQLVLVERASGAVAGRVVLSTALTPAAGKRRILAQILDLRPQHAAAAVTTRRNDR